MTMLPAALTWLNAGCSVIPIRSDGTKKPLVEWKRFTMLRPAVDDVEYWWNPSSAAGIGVVCGAVSGGLEMLELEGRAASADDFTKIYEQCDARNISWLLDVLTQQGYCEATPSGGFHFLYRISDHEVPGNTKVARRPATAEELELNPDDKIKVLSETRGEGGYVIVAPSGGTVHPTGDSWSVVAGSIGDIPTVTWADRCLLHEAIHAALDEMPLPVVQAPVRRALPFQREGTSPGDDFCERVEWSEILEPHGWRVAQYQDRETFWIRPGKKFDGAGSHSATTGFKGSGAIDRLYVFSTSTVFEAEKPYNKFAAYALLEHGGDFTAAAKDLSRRGYGSRSTSTAGNYSTGSLPVPVATAAVATVPVVAAEILPAAAPVVSGTIFALRRGLPAVSSHSMDHVEWSDLGTADLYTETFRDRFRWVTTEKSWYAWNGACWELSDGNAAEHALSELHLAMKRRWQEMKDTEDPRATPYGKYVKVLESSSRQNGVMRMIKNHPDISHSLKDFDTHTHLMAVDNGTFNIKTMQLEPANPDLLMSKKLDAPYRPEAGTGRWGTFMEQVLPDRGVREYLQRAFGYALTGEAGHRALFLLHGKSGSGKSQVVEAITKVFGSFSTGLPPATLKPRTHQGPSDDVHGLRGARLAPLSELEENSVLNEALIKSATGGDTLTTRPLYGRYTSWKPQFVIFVATNFLPRITSTDNAIWTRVKPIKFEQCFVDGNGLPLNPDDVGLGVRIATEEPECVLNWLLEGLAMFREQGLTPPEQVREWTQGYRDEVDPVRQFLTEGEQEGRIKAEHGLEVGFRDLYRAYVAWSDDNQQRPITSRRFNQGLESLGYARVRRERGVMWQGIGLAGFIGDAMNPAKQWFKT